MVNIKQFVTDGVAKAGVGADALTGLLFWQPQRDITIVDLDQPTGAALANDSDWQIAADGAATTYIFFAEQLNPANKGGKSAVAPNGIRVRKGTVLQFNWLGQAAAQANALTVYYV